MEVQEKRDIVEHTLYDIYMAMGIDVPSNHSVIREWVLGDILETADEYFNSDDVRIGFRRFIEKTELI